ncbi:S9 family peptidase, partial [Sphingobacteriales bacterium CHB3]|nr:S9 family peptidase [Sphingobacteriales bacterium CHB3]
MLLIVCLFLIPAISSSQSDTTTPLFTHEDLWLMKRVGNPMPSPDGKWVLFSLTEPSYDEKDQRSDLWIVASDGKSKPRQITFSLAGEGGMAWSPDSRKIAFTAKREGDEVAQVYILNFAEGGEAMRFT